LPTSCAARLDALDAGRGSSRPVSRKPCVMPQAAYDAAADATDRCTPKRNAASLDKAVAAELARRLNGNARFCRNARSQPKHRAPRGVTRVFLHALPPPGAPADLWAKNRIGAEELQAAFPARAQVCLAKGQTGLTMNSLTKIDRVLAVQQADAAGAAVWRRCPQGVRCLLSPHSPQVAAFGRTHTGVCPSRCPKGMTFVDGHAAVGPRTVDEGSRACWPETTITEPPARCTRVWAKKFGQLEPRPVGQGVLSRRLLSRHGET